MTVAVGVCGFPRSGSSMVMAMLHAGGVQPVEGSSLAAYELPSISPEVLEALDVSGQAVKLLDYSVFWPVPPKPGGWRFIWLDRSPREQARSMVKFMSVMVPGVLKGDAEGTFRRSFKADVPKAIRALSAAGPVLRLRFEDVVARPLAAARDLATYLHPEWSIDVEAAASIVLERDGRCRPDLAIEAAAVAAAVAAAEDL